MAKYIRDLMDKVLIDLYEKEAFVNYVTPSDSITGNDNKELQERLSKLARDFSKGGKKREDAKAELDTIFANKNKIVKSYYNIIPFLLEQRLIDYNIPNHLYNLRLTLEGVAKAKVALEYERELKNKRYLWKLSISNSFLALFLLIATIGNVFISYSMLRIRKQIINIENQQNPDNLKSESDTTKINIDSTQFSE